MRTTLISVAILLGVIAVGMFIAAIWTSDVKWMWTGYLLVCLLAGIGFFVSYLPKKRSE